MQGEISCSFQGLDLGCWDPQRRAISTARGVAAARLEEALLCGDDSFGVGQTGSVLGSSSAGLRQARGRSRTYVKNLLFIPVRIAAP